MDFLCSLPKTSRKHDATLVIVCRFSKMALFIPCTKTTSAAKTAQLFFQHVWPHYGLPASIISDRDSRLLSSFWRTIWSLLGCQSKFSTAFHLQTDGRTEVVNRILVHSLRTYFIKNTQWDNYLHIVHHSYNRATHSATGYSPFKVFLGFQPMSPTDLPLIVTFDVNLCHQKEEQSAHKFLEKLAQHHSQVNDALKRAQEKAKQRHDKH